MEDTDTKRVQFPGVPVENVMKCPSHLRFCCMLTNVTVSPQTVVLVYVFCFNLEQGGQCYDDGFIPNRKERGGSNARLTSGESLPYGRLLPILSTLCYGSQYDFVSSLIS